MYDFLLHKRIRIKIPLLSQRVVINTTIDTQKGPIRNILTPSKEDKQTITKNSTFSQSKTTYQKKHTDNSTSTQITLKEITNSLKTYGPVET